MDVKYSRNYVENSNIFVNVIEFLNLIMIRLDKFLNKIMDEHPDKMSIIIKKLSSKKSQSYPNVNFKFTDFPTLKKYPGLINHFYHTVLEQFGLLELHIIPDRDLEMTVEIYLRTGLFFRYTLAKSLLSILDQAAAVEFFQDIIDDETMSMRDPNNYLDKLADMKPDNEKFQERFRSHDTIEFKISEGKQGTKVLKCKWYEVINELDDPIISYAVACHYDFEAAKNMNPNFILTRPKTLMMGDDYCVFCYHDTRIVSKIEHPPEEFWDNL